MHVAEAALRGLFITFEGIDGAGKSSHIDTMAEHLRATGRNVMVTREPGGTPLAERLRSELLSTPMDALTEVLLVFAARRDHLTLAIEPALAAGTTVLCDRFTDSTFAYQGAGRGFDTGVLQQLESWVQNELQPDLTLWFDISPEQAAQRLSTARSPDRFEQLDAAFFHRVRRGYELRAESHARRFVRIDAGLDREAVAAQVATALKARGW